MQLRIRVPAPPKGWLSDVVGLLGLSTICVAIAFLTDWRWATLAAGVFGVALAAISQAFGAKEPVAIPRPMEVVSRPGKPAAGKSA